jgi:hypothetical protein
LNETAPVRVLVVRTKEELEIAAILSNCPGLSKNARMQGAQNPEE